MFTLSFKMIHSISPPNYLTALPKPYVPKRSLAQQEKFPLCPEGVQDYIGRSAFACSTPTLWNSVEPETQLHTR